MGSFMFRGSIGTQATWERRALAGDQAALVGVARGGEAGARTQDVSYFLRNRHSCSNSRIAKAGFQKGQIPLCRELDTVHGVMPLI